MSKPGYWDKDCEQNLAFVQNFDSTSLLEQLDMILEDLD